MRSINSFITYWYDYMIFYFDMIYFISRFFFNHQITLFSWNALSSWFPWYYTILYFSSTSLIGIFKSPSCIYFSSFVCPLVYLCFILNFIYILTFHNIPRFSHVLSWFEWSVCSLLTKFCLQQLRPLHEFQMHISNCLLGITYNVSLTLQTQHV